MNASIHDVDALNDELIENVKNFARMSNTNAVMVNLLVTYEGNMWDTSNYVQYSTVYCTVLYSTVHGRMDRAWHSTDERSIKENQRQMFGKKRVSKWG